MKVDTNRQPRERCQATSGRSPRLWSLVCMLLMLLAFSHPAAYSDEAVDQNGDGCIDNAEMAAPGDGQVAQTDASSDDAAQPTSLALVFYDDYYSFQAHLNNYVEIDFDDIAAPDHQPALPLGDHYAGYGITFAEGVSVLDAVGYGADVPPFTPPNEIVPSEYSPWNFPIVVDFDQPVHAVGGFDVGNVGEGMKVYDRSGSLLGDYVIDPSGSGIRFGAVIADSPVISRIEFYPAIGPGAVEVDNLIWSRVAEVNANGSQGPVALSPGGQLTVEITLDPRNLTATNADWWLAANTPFGWYHYDVAAGGWRPGLAVSLQGPLRTLPVRTVLQRPANLAGTYTFYFAVDTAMNGLFDPSAAYLDKVVVEVGP